MGEGEEGSKKEYRTKMTDYVERSRDFRLMTSHKDAVAEILKASGWDITQFSIDDLQIDRDKGEPVDEEVIAFLNIDYVVISRLSHVTSGYYVDFQPKKTALFPGVQDRYENYLIKTDTFKRGGIRISPLKPFQQRLSHVDAWLKNLKRELETPNIWESLARQTELIGKISSGDFTDKPFNQEEQAQIANILDKVVKDAITEHSFSEEQRTYLLDGIKDLKESSKVLRRKWWLQQATGFFVSLALTNLIQSDIA